MRFLTRQEMDAVHHRAKESLIPGEEMSEDMHEALTHYFECVVSASIVALTSRQSQPGQSVEAILGNDDEITVQFTVVEREPRQYNDDEEPVRFFSMSLDVIHSPERRANISASSQVREGRAFKTMVRHLNAVWNDAERFIADPTFTGGPTWPL